MKRARGRKIRVTGRAARPNSAPPRELVPLLLYPRYVRYRLPDGELGPVQPDGATQDPLDVSGYLPIHVPTSRAPASFTLTISDDGGAGWTGSGTKAGRRQRHGGRGRRGHRGRRGP